MTPRRACSRDIDAAEALGERSRQVKQAEVAGDKALAEAPSDSGRVSPIPRKSGKTPRPKPKLRELQKSRILGLEDAASMENLQQSPVWRRLHQYSDIGRIEKGVIHGYADLAVDHVRLQEWIV